MTRLVISLAGISPYLCGCNGTDSNSGASQDATSGASISVSAISVTSTTAKVSFSEKHSDGVLRFYYGSTAFTKATDTSRTDISRLTVTTRGSGQVSLTGLASGTTYHCFFQGFYPGKSVSTYNAWETFTTSAAAARSAESQP